MKKLWIVLLLAAAAGAAFLLYRGLSGREPAPASSSAPASSEAAPPSSQPAASLPVSSQAAESAAPSPSMGESEAAQAAEQAKKQIPLDWNKYALKPAYDQKTLDGKTYRTFELWDDDYMQGIRILVDPEDGKAYTLGPSDASPVPAAQDQAFDKTPHTVTGVMEDGAMMSIQLKLADGNTVTVRRLGVDTSGLKSLKIGDKIRVTYTGVLNGSDTSRFFVTKLETVG